MGLEPLAGFEFPPQRGVAGPPPAELRERLGRRRHHRLEHEDDVAHHHHLRVVIPELARLPGEIEGQLALLHGESHLQAHLADEFSIALAETGAAFPAKHEVVLRRHRRAHPVEIIQHLRQSRGALGAVETKILRLHAEGSHLETERRRRPVGVARVVLAKRRGMIDDAKAKHRVGDGRQRRERQQPRGVEGSRGGEGERRGAEVLQEKTQAPQNLRLGLVPNVAIRRPETRRRSPRMVQRQRRGEDAAEEVHEERRAERERVGEEFGLIRQQHAAVHGFSHRRRGFADVRDAIRHERELDGANNRGRLRAPRERLNRRVAAVVHPRQSAEQRRGTRGGGASHVRQGFRVAVAALALGGVQQRRRQQRSSAKRGDALKHPLDASDDARERLRLHGGRARRERRGGERRARGRRRGRRRDDVRRRRRRRRRVVRASENRKRIAVDADASGGGGRPRGHHPRGRRVDRRRAHRRRARPRRRLGRRVRQRVRVRSRGGGEGATRAFQRRRRRRRQLFPGNLSEVLQRLFQEDVTHAHLHQRVRATRRHPGGGGDAETRRLERESSARRVAAPRLRGEGRDGVRRGAERRGARPGTHGGHQRSLVEERQHLAVDHLGLSLARRREDERAVEERPAGPVHQRPRVDVVDEHRVHRAEPVQGGVRLLRVVLEAVARVGDGEGEVRVVPSHDVHHRVPAGFRAPTARQEQRTPPRRVSHALHHLTDPTQKTLVIARSRGAPQGEIPQPHERLSRVRQRRRLLGRRRHRQLSQRAAHVRGGFDQRSKRPDGVTGGQRHAASFHSLLGEHGVRHEVDERGSLPHGAGEIADGGTAERANQTGAFERAEEAFAARGLPGGVRGGVRAVVSGGGAGDAASGAARGGVSRLGDGFGEGGDPRVHGGGALRLEDEGAARGVLVAGLGLEHEDALAGELVRQAELGEARLGVEDAHAGVGADGRLSPGLVLARGAVAREVTERRHLRTGRGGGEREEAPVPLLAAAEGVGAALLGEPSGDDHLLARGRRRHCCFRGAIARRAP